MISELCNAFDLMILTFSDQRNLMIYPWFIYLFRMVIHKLSYKGHTEIKNKIKKDNEIKFEEIKRKIIAVTSHSYHIIITFNVYVF